MKKDKEAALLLLDLVKELEKLPDCCKIYQLNQFIHRTYMNKQYNERYDKCYCFIEIE